MESSWEDSKNDISEQNEEEKKQDDSEIEWELMQEYNDINKEHYKYYSVEK